MTATHRVCLFLASNLSLSSQGWIIMWLEINRSADLLSLIDGQTHNYNFNGVSADLLLLLSRAYRPPEYIIIVIATYNSNDDDDVLLL